MKNFKNKFYTTSFIAALCVFSTLFLLDANPAATPPDDVTQIAIVKQLKCPQMRLLNMIFEKDPTPIVRTKISGARAAATIKTIDTLQKEYETRMQSPQQTQELISKQYFATNTEESLFIQGQLRSLIDPMRQFFDVIRQHKTIVTPIITESLGITVQNDCKSWLLKFFETKENVSVFFDKAITTIDALKEACLEFIKVFGDINASLSERAQKACDDIIRKMQEAQKQSQKQK
jgi:hypothetical protein